MFASVASKLRSSTNGREYEVTDLIVRDVRFPTSAGFHGSDAIHKDPDYSCAYVVLLVEGLRLEGHGLTFTVGRGTEVR